MHKNIPSIIVTIFSLIFLTTISILFLNESIDLSNYKKLSHTTFSNLRNQFVAGNISNLNSITKSFYTSMPILEIFSIKNDQNLPIYFYSKSNENLTTINGKLKNKSIYNVIYSDKVTVGNSTYNIEAIFTVLSKRKLYYLSMKIALILFIYLISLSLFLIHAYSTRSNLNKNNFSENKKIDHRISLNSKYHGIDQIVTDELEKSASYNNNLVLIFVSSPDKFIYNNAPKLKKTLTKYFPPPNKVFRYANDIFGILLPNSDLQQGIHQIKLFDNEFTSNSTDPLKFPLLFGLSSRNGRLLIGKTLIKEARIALKKAMTDEDSSIVGFKSNSTQYREYLSKLK